MKQVVGGILLLGTFAVSDLALAVSYDCFVTEEFAERSQPIGTLKLDTQSEEVNFVAIDSYLFAACKGGMKQEAATFFTCAFVVDSPLVGRKSALEQVRAVKNLGSKVVAQEIRSIVVLPEAVGLFVQAYKRNARLFQIACQASG